MPMWQGKRKITVVTAYMKPDGVPDFALTEVEVAHDEYLNGRHYELVETQLGQAGYEVPLLHFDEFEGPPFLLPAVRKHLESFSVSCQQTNPILPF